MKIAGKLLRQAAWSWTSALLLLLTVGAYAQPKTGPFFIVKSEKPTSDDLPLKKVDVHVTISGVIADVTIVQEYANAGGQTLEAIYVFPASSQAAVYDMEMMVGDRKIVAEIAESRAARAKYEKAKSEGKTASLLEQHRPNVFQMSVGHILPNDRIKVTLKYTELLQPEAGEYAFIFPTVVGPRYSESIDAAYNNSSTWISTPYLSNGQPAQYDYSIQTTLHAGMPIQQVKSPSHQIQVKMMGNEHAQIALAPSDKNSGTHDYVLKYQLSGKTAQTGLLLFEGKDENFFLAMVQPPATVHPDAMPPREYVFILDVSGSMRGFPLEITKYLMNGLLGTLRPNDRFNIMLFESGNTMFAPVSVLPSKTNMKEAMAFVDAVQGGGSTDLLEALKTALRAKPAEGYSRSFIVVTDGYITIEQDAFDLIRKNLNEANLFAIGAGTSVNRFLIEGMARAGQGSPLVIVNEQDAQQQADNYKRYLSAPALTNVKTDFGSWQVHDVEPISLPDVMAERPIVIFGKYKGKPTGKLSVQGIGANGQAVTIDVDLSKYQASPANSALQYLWARSKVATLHDYNSLKVSTETIQEITDLGLKYRLVTPYTSFIAVDAIARETEGKDKTVYQALPMPQGVSIGAPAAGSAAKPGSVLRSSPAANAGISAVFADKQPAYPTKAAILWKSEKQAPYTLVISDLTGKEIHKATTNDAHITIDLSEEPFASVMGGALAYQVSAEGVTSEKSIVKILNRKEANAASAVLGTLLLANSTADRLSLAKAFEDQHLYPNALAIYLDILKKEPGHAQAKAAYEALLLLLFQD